jgi:hypothetical protein
LNDLLGRDVVLDTAGPLVYLGQLVALDADGFWLESADVHNSDEGHAPREQYLVESARDGIRVNRERVYVFRRVVTSISALDEVSRG